MERLSSDVAEHAIDELRFAPQLADAHGHRTTYAYDSVGDSVEARREAGITMHTGLPKSHRRMGREHQALAEPMDLVGAAGFEPTTFCSQSRRATKLRYAPTIYRVPRAAHPSGGRVERKQEDARSFRRGDSLIVIVLRWANRAARRAGANRRPGPSGVVSLRPKRRYGG